MSKRLTIFVLIATCSLAFLAVSEALPLSPGSFTDYRFYKIFASHPQFSGAEQPQMSKRSAPAANGQKRDIDQFQFQDPDFLPINFGKRNVNEQDRYWLGLGKRYWFDDATELTRLG
ncbi:hypothetical protein FO519_007556 [Halicephalobus sp. NKZ332]|nr:hypothetical protein FO519_007556 [Halicephalobus sp. NKZ332]